MNEDCLKLTSYFGERQRTAGSGFAADALLDLYGRRGIATSILLRGTECPLRPPACSAAGSSPWSGPGC
jgi:hypothetical protein